ncbi:hypothetical protein [Actinoplanes sp. NPDC020271]|uniref:hypothetical protein n=1 Tax=Actinoplanes sp. NPDC020271 TaxID=3363896 RepID=UPI00379439AC
MSAPLDRHRDQRQRLLAGVVERLRRLGIPVSFGQLTPYRDFYGQVPDGLTGLVVDEPSGPGSMQVTVVAAHRTGESSTDPHLWVRDVDLEYDLVGDVYFEVTTLDESGDGDAVWAPRQLVGTEEGVVDAIRLWHSYRDTLRATPPPPDPRLAARRAKLHAARVAAAETGRVRFAVDESAVPAVHRPGLAVDLTDLDHAQVGFHFPRDRNGRFSRSAVVALTGYGTVLGRRGPWLVVRNDGGELVARVEALIDVNQDHRWDRLPWLWRSSGQAATPEQRWQAPSAEQVRPITDLLDQHAIADALTLSGVEVDPDLGALLDGFPISYTSARYTETWVRSLYAQLAGSAPWRFADGFRAWQDERREAGRSPQYEVALFGLKGLNQQSRPMVALSAPHGVCRLTMIWSASNARLPRALWERPADLLG